MRDTSITLSRNTNAGGLIAASVILFSFFAVLVAFSGTESPFLFTCVWKIGLVLGLGVFIGVRYLDLLRSRSVRRLIWQRIPSIEMTLLTAAQFQIALFAWSASVVDVSITTVLYETWPLGLVLLTAWLFRSELRYERVGPLTALAFVVAVVGVLLVALSHAGDADFPRMRQFITDAPYALAGGVALALGAALLQSLSSFGFRWGADLAVDLPGDGKHGAASLEVFGVAIGLMICSLFAIPGLAVIGLARNEPVVPGSLSAALIGGPLISATASILWRWGILMTTSLKIQVISYFRPLLALLWLYSLSLVGDVDGGLLFGGAVVIVIANLIAWAEGRQRGESSASAPVQPREPKNVYELVAGGESSEVEFKSTLRMNIHTNKTDKRLENSALKTLAGFLNTDGGTLLIGVSDDGAPAGIEADSFKNEDNMGLHLTNIVNARLGQNAMTSIRPIFEDYEDKRVLVVDCGRSPSPVYVQDGDTELFYVRTGPATSEMSVSDSVEYISRRFES